MTATPTHTQPQRATIASLYASGKEAQAHDEYATARRYFQEALQVQVATLGHMHADTAQTLSILGNVAYREGALATARRYYQEALTVNDVVHGRAHPETAAILHGLGLVAAAEYCFPQARSYFADALKIREATLGRIHQDTGDTIHQLARVAAAEEDYPRARQAYQDELAIRTALAGADHAEAVFTVYDMSNLARNARQMTGWCAFLTFIWLPWPMRVVAALGVIGLGWFGYKQQPRATIWVHRLLRVLLALTIVRFVLSGWQIAWGAVPLGMSLLMLAIGAFLGFAWPWLKSDLRQLFLSRPR
ncbi:MAG: tetratricopeptide repeat protein [Candidatus Viridilinea halotolerans]|uniref:Tetratricopeptide repeat protein n=1 Tax=Candidatus Viridilinea halotolerans TaxID=2491704 RepID=A0A426U0V1_9CHLR|nr:MAG: tetratricopeptide repeat protein [Candidatus Viridilinea halotolerans]